MARGVERFVLHAVRLAALVSGRPERDIDVTLFISDATSDPAAPRWVAHVSWPGAAADVPACAPRTTPTAALRALVATLNTRLCARKVAA